MYGISLSTYGPSSPRWRARSGEPSEALRVSDLYQLLGPGALWCSERRNDVSSRRSGAAARRAQGREGEPSTGRRMTCREYPPPPGPRLSSDTVNQESDAGSSDIQMALLSILAVALGRKGGIPRGPQLADYLLIRNSKSSGSGGSEERKKRDKHARPHGPRGPRHLLKERSSRC